jgi:hypothetical protein
MYVGRFSKNQIENKTIIRDREEANWFFKIFGAKFCGNLPLILVLSLMNLLILTSLTNFGVYIQVFLLLWCWWHAGALTVAGCAPYGVFLQCVIRMILWAWWHGHNGTCFFYPSSETSTFFL